MTKYASTQNPHGTTHLRSISPVSTDDRQEARRYLARRKIKGELPDIEDWQGSQLAGWLDILGLS